MIKMQAAAIGIGIKKHLTNTMKKAILLLCAVVSSFAVSATDYEDMLHTTSKGFIETNPTLAIAIGAVIFIVAAIIVRAIFSISRIVRSLRAQNYLLALIAEKQGCDVEKIRYAMNHMEGILAKTDIPHFTDK